MAKINGTTVRWKMVWYQSFDKKSIFVFQILKIHWRKCNAIKHSLGDKRVERNQERNELCYMYISMCEILLTTDYIKYQFVKLDSARCIMTSSGIHLMI